MASAFSHIAVPLALTMACGFKHIPKRLLVLGMLLSVIPDLDVLGFNYGIKYESQWGHRGFTHSVFLAFLIGLIAAFFSNYLTAKHLYVFLFAFVSMLSHGILDACTSGGLGVEFWWPFNESRYFFSFREIKVSPIGVKKFFSERGFIVLKSEFIYILLPCLFVGISALFIRKNLKN
ncbi:metal-dependent hydrolase [Pigmentibacter sp. JX0631]|uniref:metal-dependent hydrolase n=1 Tax=Pigmentibacter sp. JX0631 TaxID=2976982 RepID=UPI002469C274|nr:metal-dependent hydrolase [Pigmentibacter sp. JX0631]WGL61123.1 metal-dependent hydrolase [Pigmentibacter sp. JX0631]